MACVVKERAGRGEMREGEEEGSDTWRIREW